MDMGNERTTDDVARRILRTEDIGRNRAREVANADLECHPDSAFILSCEVIPEPMAPDEFTRL